MIEIYPGGRVEFVISEFDEKKKKVKGAPQVEIVRLGNAEKNEFEAFTNGKLTIKSNSGITVTYVGFNFKEE